MKTIFSLTSFPFLEIVTVLSATPDLAALAGERTRNNGRIPWELSYCCPHCGRDIHGRELIDPCQHIDTGMSFVAGCPGCHLRFRAEVPSRLLRGGSVDPTAQADGNMKEHIDILQCRSQGATMQNRPRILFISLEFPTWQEARSWSYAASLGFEEGFRANGVEFLTIPALIRFTPPTLSNCAPV
jgi:hypothetical protein